MKGQQLFLAFLAISIPFASASSAGAQRPGSPERFSRPTFSPWFGLFSRETRALDNYHSYVRPEIRLRNTLGQQANALRQQKTTILGLGQEIRAVERGGGPRPTGTGSGFMIYSHYFQTVPAVRGQSRLPPSRPAKSFRSAPTSRSYWSLPNTGSHRSLPPLRARGPAIAH